jgi:hypothetical protein
MVGPELGLHVVHTKSVEGTAMSKHATGAATKSPAKLATSTTKKAALKPAAVVAAPVKKAAPAAGACSQCGRVNTRPAGASPDCRDEAACKRRRLAATA